MDLQAGNGAVGLQTQQKLQQSPFEACPMEERSEPVVGFSKKGRGFTAIMAGLMFLLFSRSHAVSSYRSSCFFAMRAVRVGMHPGLSNFLKRQT
jgi:hypothetical protein